MTVSLVLPTLNEEETIGPIVHRAIREMMGRVPLLDEILVIDSASTDRTREIAEAEGARVVEHPAVPPLRLVHRQGRGALEVALRDLRRHRRVGRHGRPQLASADGLRDPRAAPGRAAAAVRQGLLPAADRRVGHAQGRRRRAGHRARRAAADQPLLPRAVGLHPAARRRVRRPPQPARDDPVLHRLRGRDGPSHRRRRTGRDRGPRPGRPRAPRPPQPGARRPVADVVRDPPGGHEAARGAAQGTPVRRARLDHEAAALGRGGWASRSSSWPTTSGRR